MLIHIWIQVLPIHVQCMYYSHCLPEELFVKLIGHYSCKNYSLSGTIISTYQFQKFSTGKIASLPDGVCGAKRLEWRGSSSSKSRLQETCCGGGLDLNGVFCILTECLWFLAVSWDILFTRRFSRDKFSW